MSCNYFDNQSKKTSDENKIRNNPSSIKSLEQTPENCLLAVSLYYKTLEHIPKALQTEELCLIAVRQCGYALKYVSEKIITEEICFEAIKLDSVKTFNYNVFSYIPKAYLTTEFCQKAYDINPKILYRIPYEFYDNLDIISDEKPSLSFTQKVADDGLSLKNIPTRNISKNICVTDINNNALSLEFIPNRFKTNELCETALEKDFKCISFCNESLITLDFIKNWFKKVIKNLQLQKAEDEKIDIELANSNYNVNIYELKKIFSEFPEHINNDPEIIDLQRKLRLRRFISKKFDKETQKFITIEKILNLSETEEETFSKFEDFYNYVNCNLNQAYLYDFNFEGIDLKAIDISDAFISSKVLVEQKLYDPTYYNSLIPTDNTYINPSKSIENETFDTKSLIHSDDIQSIFLNENDIKFYYISDIHLMHKIKNKFPNYATEEEIFMYIKSLVKNLKNSINDTIFYRHKYLLIGGDISFNFEISKFFYSELERQIGYTIIVVLGNHELWCNDTNDCDNNINEIIDKYKTMLEPLRIHLLHNQLLLLEENQIRISTYEQLLNISEERLRDIALKSPFLLLGGLGFTGYDKDFNASCGLYRGAITSIEKDLIETTKFEEIYLKLKKFIPNEKLIVFTHTPKSNWSTDNYNKNWIYVNGHTHKNEYFIDDEKTVYSDNQIGYKSTSVGLKSFKLSGTYDTFKHFSDGKYVIERELYAEFNKGMKILCTFKRVDGIIHMLKKCDNYCFFYELNEKLYILNCGSIKKADYQDLNYYYDRLDVYSNAIKSMLSKYNSALKEISIEIKKFGGSGTIHGCIVDIDGLNHIYLNYFDGSMIPYFATDIINKKVYPSVKALLKANDTKLYNNYIEMTSNDKSILSSKIVKNSVDIELSKYVFDTSMYEPSRIMKHLQYTTESNIIRFWNDEIIRKIEKKLST